MKFVSRKAWGARSPRARADRLSSTRGVKVHYTGDTVDTRLTSDHARCAAKVKSIQNGHMDGNGWNDVGYSALVCPHGNVFEGRGLHALPSANGAGLNSGHYAVCGLVGNKGLTKPSNAMLNGIRDAIEWLRAKGDAGNEIAGHRDGYATDCPGGPLYAWVKKGAPRPDQTTTEEDDVPDYVSVGVTKAQELAPNKWVTVNFGEDYADTEHQHADEGGPSILWGPALYALTASLTIKGLPPGTECQVRAVEVQAADTSKQESGPVQEFTGTQGDTYVMYALPADSIGDKKRLRLQVIQYGKTPAQIVAGGAKVLYWRT